MAKAKNKAATLTNFLRFLAGTILFELAVLRLGRELDIDSRHKKNFLRYLAQWLFGKNEERSFRQMAMRLSTEENDGYWTKFRLKKWSQKIEKITKGGFLGFFKRSMSMLFLHPHKVTIINKKLNIGQAFLALPVLMIGKHVIPQDYQYLWLFSLSVRNSKTMFERAQKLAVSGVLTGLVVLIYPLIEYPLAALIKHLITTKGFPIATTHQISIAYTLFFSFYIMVVISEYLSLKANREVVFLGSAVLRYLAGFSVETSVVVGRIFDLLVDNFLFQIIIAGVSTKFLIADLIAKLPLFAMEFYANMWFRLRKSRIFKLK